MTAASAIGDDTLQRKAQGRVVDGRFDASVGGVFKRRDDGNPDASEIEHDVSFAQTDR